MTSDASNDEHGLRSPDYRRDPYAAFARLRGEAPVFYSDAWKGWLVTRHADVSAGFRHPALSANRMAMYARVLPEPVLAQVEPLLRNVSHWILMMDPPAQTRIRSLLASAFTPRFIERLRPSIQAMVDGLLAEVAEAEGFDLVHAVAHPLPVKVIGEMLGLPAEDYARLKVWSDHLAAFLGMSAIDPKVVAAAVRSVVEMEAYFLAVIDERRASPGEDLVSLLVGAHDDESQLSAQELVSSCCALLFGGHETTTNLIANAMLLLLQHPDQAAILRARPERIDAAIEEVLRFETPVQRMGRVTTAPVEIAGTTIPAGQRVFLMMGSANRDPEHVADPDRFDVDRSDPRHLSFGLGAHYCLGAALGRLEAKLVLPAILERFPALRLDPGHDPADAWLDNLTVRGLARLPVLTGR